MRINDVACSTVTAIKFVSECCRAGCTRLALSKPVGKCGKVEW